MLKRFAALVCILAVSWSAASKTEAKLDSEKIKGLIQGMLGLSVTSVQDSPMPGVAEVITERGVFYTSYDGKFLLQGKLYGIDGGVVNYTEESLAQVRLDGVKRFEDDMIVFKAKEEKYVVNVFTDITCGYCRKMHDQIEDYNDLGITVRYLAYPRAGVQDRSGGLSKGFKDLRSIWCHEDSASAMTKAKQGSTPAQRICDAPIAEEFAFGQQVGVSGTPAMILENGFLLPGYREPQDLVKILASM